MPIQDYGRFMGGMADAVQGPMNAFYQARDRQQVLGQRDEELRQRAVERNAIAQRYTDQQSQQDAETVKWDQLQEQAIQAFGDGGDGAEERALPYLLEMARMDPGSAGILAQHFKSKQAAAPITEQQLPGSGRYLAMQGGNPVGQPWAKPEPAAAGGGTSGAKDPVDPDQVATVAEMVRSGSIPVPSGMALRTPFWIAVMTAVGNGDPGFSASEYPAQAGTLKNFTSGTESRTVRSLNVAIEHISTLGRLADALGNGNVHLLNKAKQEYTQQFGGAAPVTFDAAKQIVAAEIIKSVTTGGGGMQERMEAQDMVNKAQSPAQLKQVIDTWHELMAGQMRGLQQQYEQGVGPAIVKNRPFEKMMSPGAIRELASIQSAASGSAVGNAPPADRLKEGVHTTFANKQVWTLQNGKPVRVK